MWHADDPKYSAARKPRQSRGTSDNICLQGSHPYNCRPSLPKPDNVSRVHRPPPYNGHSFETGIPRLKSGPSDQSIDIPGINPLRKRDECWQGGTDHGRFWAERSRLRERIGGDRTPRDREPSTPSGFSQQFRLPPIQSLGSSESLLGEPAKLGPGFSVNVPPPQLRMNPRYWPYMYVTLLRQQFIR
jgi:hypothetical protein